jgi:hypothetical protein
MSKTRWSGGGWGGNKGAWNDGGPGGLGPTPPVFRLVAGQFNSDVGTGAGPLHLSLADPVTPGNFLLLVLSQNMVTFGGWNFTDNLGLTWSDLNITDLPTIYSLSLSFAPVTSSGPITVTVTSPNANGFLAWLQEVQGPSSDISNWNTATNFTGTGDASVGPLTYTHGGSFALATAVKASLSAPHVTVDAPFTPLLSSDPSGPFPGLVVAQYGADTWLYPGAFTAEYRMGAWAGSRICQLATFELP